MQYVTDPLGKATNEVPIINILVKTQLLMHDKGGFFTLEFSTPEGGLRNIRKTEPEKNNGILENSLPFIQNLLQVNILQKTSFMTGIVSAALIFCQPNIGKILTKSLKFRSKFCQKWLILWIFHPFSAKLMNLYVTGGAHSSKIFISEIYLIFREG